MSGQEHERDSEEWAHVDPDHPRPWDGCIQRGLCCSRSPGWFAPGEVERAAAHLGLDMGDFVNRFLVLDHLDTTIGRVEAFAPLKVGRDGEPVEPPGQKTSDYYPNWERPCVFFEHGACRIYPVRPLECRLYVCTNLPEDNPAKLDLALLWLGAWRSQQDDSLPSPPEHIEDIEELRSYARLVRARFDPGEEGEEQGERERSESRC